MAYAAVVTIEEGQKDGFPFVSIHVAETEAAAASEWSTVASSANTVSVNGVALAVGKSYKIPRRGRFVLTKAVKESGAAATILPRWGMASGWAVSTMNAIGGDSAAAVFQNSSVPLTYAYAPGQAAVLYGRSISASGTDNVIKSLILIAGDSE